MLVQWAGTSRWMFSRAYERTLLRMKWITTHKVAKLQSLKSAKNEKQRYPTWARPSECYKYLSKDKCSIYIDISVLLQVWQEDSWTSRPKFDARIAGPVAASLTRRWPRFWCTFDPPWDGAEAAINVLFSLLQLHCNGWWLSLQQLRVLVH
jgi:hypothetical protein